MPGSSSVNLLKEGWFIGSTWWPTGRRLSGKSAHSLAWLARRDCRRSLASCQPWLTWKRKTCQWWTRSPSLNLSWPRSASRSQLNKISKKTRTMPELKLLTKPYARSSTTWHNILRTCWQRPAEIVWTQAITDSSSATTTTMMMTVISVTMKIIDQVVSPPNFSPLNSRPEWSNSFARYLKSARRSCSTTHSRWLIKRV